MPATPHPLIWEYSRKVDDAKNLGGVVHYYDEMSQSLWLDNGIQTNIADIPHGHWKTSTPDPTLDIGTPKYLSLSLDHAYNGVLFGVATLGSALVFLRYIYAFDCSDIISSGSLSYSNNNAVAQLKVNLMNIKDAVFSSDSTLFQPGARVTLRLIAGDELPYDMCVAWLDSVDYNIKSSTVPISGRNSIGFKLMQSTFDENTSITGYPQEVVAKIMELGGVTRYAVQPGKDSRTHEFTPDQTLMSGLEQLCDFYSGWRVVELASGVVVVGYPSFIKDYQPTGYYMFEEGTAFKRRTKRSSDAAYTRVRVTGVDANGEDLTPVVIEVSNYSQWNLPIHKTYHDQAPEGYTQEELQSYAENLAASLQYVGIGEDFTASIQPQLTIGDIAALQQSEDTMISLGVINSIKHTFGKSGYTTEFSTDSGGAMVATYDADDSIVTSTKPLNGYNRKQTLKDLIQVASGSATAGPQTGGGVIKVVTSSNALTLEGKTYNQIIQDTKFKAGETISLSNLIILGQLTQDGLKLIGHINLGKPIGSQLVSVESCIMTAVQDSEYVFGGLAGSQDVTSVMTVPQFFADSGIILFNCTTNLPLLGGKFVAVSIDSLTIKFS